MDVYNHYKEVPFEGAIIIAYSRRPIILLIIEQTQLRDLKRCKDPVQMC